MQLATAPQPENIQETPERQKLIFAHFEQYLAPSTINWKRFLELEGNFKKGEVELSREQIVSIMIQKIPVCNIENLFKLNKLEHEMLAYLFHGIDFEKLQKRFGIGILIYFYLADQDTIYKYDLEIYMEEHFPEELFSKLQAALHSSFRINMGRFGLNENCRLFVMLQTMSKYIPELPPAVQQAGYSLGQLELKRGLNGSGYARGHDNRPKQNEDISSYEGKGDLCTIRIDGPLSICLYKDANPVAVISGYQAENDTFVINQMQKTTYDRYDNYGRLYEKSTHPSMRSPDFNRQKVLYDALCEVVKVYGFQKIKIIGGENNKRTSEPLKIVDMTAGYSRRTTVPGSFDLSVDIAKRIYDVFARKQNYKKNKEGDREKPLFPTQKKSSSLGQ